LKLYSLLILYYLLGVQINSVPLSFIELNLQIHYWRWKVDFIRQP